ncbi:MAG: hypothetical protein AAF753_09450 [Pseudomonadota bacterium]
MGAGAQDSAALGLHIMQHGEPVALRAEPDGRYRATILPAPFGLDFPDKAPEQLFVTFGLPGLFELLDAPPEEGLFGPASAYARHQSPRSAHFLTDPQCAGALLRPGFNILEAAHREGTLYPVARIEVDNASRACRAAGPLPIGTDLLGYESELHAVMMMDNGQIVPLILEFAGS